MKALHLWNGNKALTLAAIVLICFFAWKFYEAKDEVEYRHTEKIDQIRMERKMQMDSLFCRVRLDDSLQIDKMELLFQNQLMLMSRIDSLRKELRNK